MNRLEQLIDYRIKSNQLLNLSLTRRDYITKPLKEGEIELIISLTTYSKRIHYVHLVIESIAQQTIKANRLILWLDENEFTLETIPLILHKQIERGLEVRFCPNYKSYKKLIPTLKEFPNADIITIDDDILYPHDMIEVLMREHKEFPDVIIANRMHKILFSKSAEILPYRDWEHGIKSSVISEQNVAIGVGGILYPAGALHAECLDIAKAFRLAPNADDIWFKAMSLLNGIQCKKVDDDRDFWRRFLLIPDSQDIALYLKNWHENANDGQIQRVFEEFNLYEK